MYISGIQKLDVAIFIINIIYVTHFGEMLLTISQITVFLRLEDKSFISFLNNPKNLEPSYKTDLNFWNCFGKVKLVL